MRDFNDFRNIIKKAAMEAVNNSKPVGVEYGKVISISPLKIFIDQKKTLTNLQLVITKTVESLVVGDKVIILREQGGQKYVIIDRVI